METTDQEYWYYFGKCTPMPIQIRKGMTPRPPYMRFKTKEECQLYIEKQNEQRDNGKYKYEK